MSCTGNYSIASECPENSALLPDPTVQVGFCQLDTSFVDRTYIGDDDGWVGGPGWYIDNQRLTKCPLGYYCPLQDGVYDSKIKCDDGEFCPPQVMEPHECNGLLFCSGDTVVTAAAGAVIVVFLIILSIILCTIFRIRKNKQLKKSDFAAIEYGKDALEIFGKKFESDTKKVAIEFKDVGFHLNNKQKTNILSDINGHFPPGALVALMGPSGCGKTTFMNAVSDRAPYGTMTGTVTVNGVANGLSSVPNQLGFVPQDDTVRPQLTVWQNLMYNAELRLPPKYTREEKMQHVQHCISVLGLEKVRNNLVGDAEKRGVSGGQRKRVNIGVELVAAPSVLFMDEPTSGLDGAATVALARCLSILRESGLTIICVIHQPRAAVFNEFTHILLLGDGGRQIYSGRREYLVNHLTEIGFRLPQGENPADWMIDVCCDLETCYLPNGEKNQHFEAPRMLFEYWEKNNKAEALIPNSKYHTNDPEPELLEPLASRENPRFGTQAYYLIGRAFVQLNLDTFFTSVFVLFIMGFGLNISGAISDFTWKYTPGSIVGLANIMVFSMTAGIIHRPTYGAQKLLLLRELNSGVSPTGVFIGETLKTWVVAFFQSLAYASFAYIVQAPLQPFWNIWFAYYGLMLWWAGIAHWASLAFSQDVATMVCLFWPVFEAIYSGAVGADATTSELEDLTVRGLGGLSTISAVRGRVGRWAFQWVYAAEINEWPDYIRYQYDVNASLYWREIGEPGDNLQEKVTEAATSLFFRPWYFPFWNWITLLLLWSMKAAAKRAFKAKLDKCIRPCYTCCGLPDIFASTRSAQFEIERGIHHGRSMEEKDEQENSNKATSNTRPPSENSSAVPTQREDV